MVSGGFDPLHPGHVEYIERASAMGLVTVALNSDDWLVRKKGYRFQNWRDRCAILMAMQSVYQVSDVDDSDGTVCEAIRRLRPEIFAKGGDRTSDNTPEAKLCEELGIKVVYGLGDKIASSSNIFTGGAPEVARKWGTYRVLYNDGAIQIKILTVRPGEATSKQRHAKRNELFVPLHDLEKRLEDTGTIEDVTGLAYIIRAGVWHQLANDNTGKDEVWLEVQFGEAIDEEDIERK